MSVRNEGTKKNPRWYTSFMIAGVRVHKPAGTRTRQGALLFEADLRRQMVEGDESPRLRKAPRLNQFSGQFLDFVRDSQTLKPGTKRCYRNGWRLLAATNIVNCRLDKIWPADVDMLTFPGSGSNANQALRTLSRMLSLAHERKIIATPPRLNLRKEKKRKSFVKELWMEELLLGLACPTLHDVMLIMFDAGPRPEEIVRMRRGDILWAERSIHIPDGKTENAERYIPLTDRVAEMLQRRLSSHNSEWVFPSQMAMNAENRMRALALHAAGVTTSLIARELGVSWSTANKYLKPATRVGTKSASGHVTATSVGGKMWQKLRAAANAEIKRKGLPPLPDDLVLYSMRHTFASRFLKASRNDRAALKSIMGHSSFSVSERYVHPGLSEAAEVMNSFNTEWRKLRPIEKRA